jgi:radical SAM superfamily enzyme YgiQ (UPF0313 family)
MPTSSILLLIPPLTQLNTPYPSTAYLTGFLRARGYVVAQADLGIEMMLAVFSRSGLQEVFALTAEAAAGLAGEARQMLALQDAYLATIDPVISFLQGRDPMFAPHLAREGFLPEGPRFAAVRERNAVRRHDMSLADAARYRATLYLEDLMDLIAQVITPHFALNRYAEHIGRSTSSFQTIEHALKAPLALTDEFLIQALWRHVERQDPSVIGLTVPFPGNLFGAFRIARSLKQRRPDLTVVLGGGYVNTELRRLSDPSVFDYVDYVTLDDGERPFLCLLEYLNGARDPALLCRTFRREEGKVRFYNGCREPDLSMAEIGTPTYEGLHLDRYVSILDSVNPMHRLWSEGHWNKLTVAHGCYWKQCTFCDVGLDYISRYEAAPTAILVDRIETLVRETGRRGFHFVDEAAPPAGLKTLALGLLERRLAISWWTNIRFEEAFTPDLCRLLAASGCIAMSAGLEAASDRLLSAMKKGITVDQTAMVASALRKAGILVHAYLMYGFPGQTIQETIDSLERVRQLFAAGLLQSAFWHQFVATAHSPIGLAPAAHGISVHGPRFDGFAENDLIHQDADGERAEWVGQGLRTALFNYMERNGLEADVRVWFDRPLAPPSVRRNWSRQALAATPAVAETGQERRGVWIGGRPVLESIGRARAKLILPTRTEDVVLSLPPAQARWLTDMIHAATPEAKSDRDGYPRLIDMRKQFEETLQRDFDEFRNGTAWQRTRKAGLLLV